MIKKILKATYHVFHDSLARREDYVDIKESDEFPLPFYDARCLEDEKVTGRAIDIWCNICKICKFWERLEKKGLPTMENYV